MRRSADRKDTLEQTFRMNPAGRPMAAQKDLDPDGTRAPQSQNSAPGLRDFMETQDREGMLMQAGKKKCGLTLG